MGEPSLYERLGGVYAVSAVVDSFSDQLVEKGTLEEQNSNIEDWNEHKAASRLPEPEIPADIVALCDRRRAVRVHGPTSGRCTFRSAALVV